MAGSCRAPESSFQSDRGPGFASSKIFPLAIPWARKANFSPAVKTVGSRPSMKRPKAFSKSRMVGEAA